MRQRMREPNTYTGSRRRLERNRRLTGLAISGIIDESGNFNFVRADGVQYVGTATATSDSLSANFDGYEPVGQTFSDGSTSGSGSISGSLSLRTSMQLTDQFTTAKGSSTSGSVSLTFNNWSYASGSDTNRSQRELYR